MHVNPKRKCKILVCMILVRAFLGFWGSRAYPQQVRRTRTVQQQYWYYKYPCLVRVRSRKCVGGCQPKDTSWYGSIGRSTQQLEEAQQTFGREERLVGQKHRSTQESHSNTAHVAVGVFSLLAQGSVFVRRLRAFVTTCSICCFLTRLTLYTYVRVHTAQ